MADLTVWEYIVLSDYDNLLVLVALLAGKNTNLNIFSSSSLLLESAFHTKLQLHFRIADTPFFTKKVRRKRIQEIIAE